jgi:hypothetical protein
MNKKILFFKKHRSILLPSFRDTLFGSESKKRKNVFFCIGRREETIMRKMVRGLFVLAAMTAALTMVACSGKKAETTAAAESKMETEAAKESVKADDKKDDKKDAKETTAAAEESESTEESSK